MCLPERPGAARRLVPTLDVVESPLDLRYRVGQVVRAVLGHLRGGQRLRNAVRAGTRVLVPFVPVALLVPHGNQAAHLIDAETELMITWLVGGRDGEHAMVFMDDLAKRLANRVQLTSDGHRAYLEAVEGAFGADIDYAQTEAFCTYGAIGVKVWIYKGEKFDK